MRKKIIYTCFILNVILVIGLLAQLFLIFVMPLKIIWFYSNYASRSVFTIIYFILVIPSMFFWFYNMYFLLRNDRYSKSIIPLLVFNVLYSPFYFHAVHIRKRPLINSFKPEPVLGKTIHLEEYEKQ